jgi:hypothetical protein
MPFNIRGLRSVSESQLKACLCSFRDLCSRWKVPFPPWIPRLRDGEIDPQACYPFNLSFSSQPTAIPDPTVIIAQFKQAAINAKEAGFDGVECASQMLKLNFD